MKKTPEARIYVYLNQVNFRTLMTIYLGRRYVISDYSIILLFIKIDQLIIGILIEKYG